MIKDKQKEYLKNRIRKEQKKYLIRPIIYSLLLIKPAGLTLEDITFILNNTLGIRQYKLSFKQVNEIINSYTQEGNQKVFIKEANKYRIRKIARKTNTKWNKRPKETKQEIGGLKLAH